MKIPAAKGNPDLLREISETFATVPGIEQIAINPATDTRQTGTDLRKRNPSCYFSSWRAMTMRWIWLVPS